MPEKNKTCSKCQTENPIEAALCKNCSSSFDNLTSTSSVEFENDLKKIIDKRYKLINEIGKGNMGVVYKAWDCKLDRYIALKTLKFENVSPLKLDTLRKRLIIEAKTAAKLKHPNIVVIYDVGEMDKSEIHIAMEYIEGIPLSEFLISGGLHELELVINIITQLCDAMSHAHEKGIIHRDLKPSNIMITGGKEIKVTDFGLAIFYHDFETRESDRFLFIGSPAYMSPERINGDQGDHCSDIYSIGIIFYELFTGKRPFQGKTRDELFKNVLKAKYEPVKEFRQDIPDFIEKIISRTLDKNPSKRYQDAKDLKKELIDLNKEFLRKEMKVPKATTIWKVPFHRNINFIGREETLTRLRNKLTTGEPASNILSMHGLGGIGKTQIALEYIYRHAKDYSLIWWINAEEPASLASDFASLAVPLGLPTKDLKEHEIVEMVCNNLERIEGWLIIFDNADSAESISNYIPKSDTGHVIITSRNPNWGGVALTRHIEELKLDDSVEFLLKRTHEKDIKAVEILARALGRLPLALEQAGAYIEATGCSLSDYLRMLKKHQKKLLSRGKPTDYTDNIATTWEISFQKVKKESQTGAELINLCAFLAAECISLKIIKDGAKHLPKTISEIVKDPVELDDAVSSARRYSLINRTGETISMHSLVQAVARDRLDENTKAIWAEAAIRIINDAFRFDKEDMNTWAICSQLLNQIQVVAMYAERNNVAVDIKCELMTKMGKFLENKGQYFKAKNILKISLISNQAFYGVDNPKVAVVLNALGFVLFELGENNNAMDLFKNALKIDEKTYGPTHPNVAEDMGHIAMVLREIGKLEEARTYFERAFIIDERYYGSNHHAVANDYSLLGVVLRDLGAPKEAKEYFEKSLAIDEAIYGPEHPNIARTTNNLG
ncbi:tetratricopeptide repeat protein, partial [bacterium]|nr:tetratricopeptide repeat protein [bacterium]